MIWRTAPPDGIRHAPEGLVLVFAILTVFASGAASASAAPVFDGAWCGPGRQRIVIDGSRVVTPGDQVTSGRKHGNAYRFMLPEGEDNAGTEIWLNPEPDGSMRVSRLRENAPGPPPHDAWRRCDAISQTIDQYAA